MSKSFLIALSLLLILGTYSCGGGGSESSDSGAGACEVQGDYYVTSQDCDDYYGSYGPYPGVGDNRVDLQEVDGSLSFVHIYSDDFQRIKLSGTVDASCNISASGEWNGTPFNCAGSYSNDLISLSCDKISGNPGVISGSCSIVYQKG